MTSSATATIQDRVRLLHATMHTFAAAKRFNERWLGDPAFRLALVRDPEAALARSEIALDPHDVRAMLSGDGTQATSISRGIFAITAAKSMLMKEWYGPEATARDPRFAAWRERQAKRMRLELGPFPANSSIRGAWNAALSAGCSGGCWFCNLAAPALTSIAPADPDALEEWRGIVRVMAERFGPAIRTGFLDGATDPFDHLEYEAFCRVVQEEAGFYPPTATALALRDPERSRRFFVEAREAGCWSIRLTVRTTAELDALHQRFTAGELSHVQVNVMSPDATFVYALTGRYRDRYLADPDFAARERRKLALAPWYTADPSYRGDDDYPYDGNTAVVGFSIDLVGRTLALVVPRASSDTFPLGIETLESLPFDDVDDFGTAMATLIDRWMPTRMPLDAAPRLLDWLRTEPLPNGIRLHGRFAQYVDLFDDPCDPCDPGDPVLGRLEPVLREGISLASNLPARIGASPSSVHTALDRLFDSGVLDWSVEGTRHE